jgi:HAD superfamily hydrolase (TIGR01549 family)
MDFDDMAIERLRAAGGGREVVRAMLFDLDGTLYRQARLRQLMALELLTMPLGGPIKALRRLRALRAFRQAQERLRLDGDADPARRQVEAAAAAAGLPVAEVDALVAEWMMERPLKYLQFCRAPGLDRLLDLLTRAGVRAGILSDYPADAKLRALGLEGRFAPVLCASDPAIGAFKPSPRGFLRACEVWNLKPTEVLCVGDRIDVDAAGAAAAGMPCVIIGRTHRTVASAEFVVLPSLERLSRVFDGH